MPRVIVRALHDEDRNEIAQWHYPGDLAIYDPGPGAADLRAPDHVALASPYGELVGYGTFGRQAQVPGGAYPVVSAAVDLGLGLRPDLVGMGYGADALFALIEEGKRRLAPARFRVTVASANARATALVERAGFRRAHRFERPTDEREFVQYERDAMQAGLDPSRPG